MDRLRITGGRELNGTIPISGAKNAALPLMTASLLTEGTLRLKNLPHLADITTLASVLAELGCDIVLNGELQDGDSGRVIEITAKNIDSTTAPYDLVRKMRASILVLGPLLARFGAARVSLPGGCAIGTRPVDLHIKALEQMGAQIDLEDGYIVAAAPNGLNGAKITFPKVSVGATENLMMAATLAKGTTTLANAAREPEITDLGECLNAMGAKITGLGTDKLTIEGVEKLNGADHTVLPDRIETGTYAIAVAMTGGKVLLKNARLDLIETVVRELEMAGITLTQTDAGAEITRNRKVPLAIDVMTEPYPGFPTDLQAQIMAMLSISEGAGMVTETIFENRFMHVPELVRMGANITVHQSSALVRGVEKLKGAQVMATDLRASVCLVLAGLVAEGETTISRIYHLDRGYEQLVEKLTACGARLERLSDSDDGKIVSLHSRRAS